MGLSFGSITDHEREIMNENDLWQETVIDGSDEIPNTSVYKTYEDMQAGNPIGSYSNSGGSGGSQWGQIFKALESSNAWKQNKQQQQQSGYKGGWGQPFAQGSGANVTPMGSGKWMHQYQPAQIAGVINHPAPPQDSGGGLGGIIGTIGGAVIGSTFGQPALGAKIGGGIGSAIG